MHHGAVSQHRHRRSGPNGSSGAERNCVVAFRHFTLRMAGPAFDLTVMTNSTTTKLYFLLVQCSATCFVSNYKQIAAVTGSFTIGGGS